MIRALFMGSPAAAVPSLAGLAGVAEIAAVVTQPDAARGRSKHKVAPPMKAAAEEWGYRTIQPDSRASLQEAVDSVQFDIGVVVAYGRLLPTSVLDSCRFGFLNVHFSLLPRWRGAAPVERAILAGDDVTGVALMLLDEGLDTGPVISVRETPIEPDDTGGVLTARLSHIGADLLIDSLDEFVSGKREPAPQLPVGATIAPRLATAEARIDGTTDVGQAERMVRAFNPRPGAWTIIDGDRVKIFGAAWSDHPTPPGSLSFVDDAPVIGLRAGSLELTEVQQAGQRPMSGREWGNGRRHQPGMLEPAAD